MTLFWSLLNVNSSSSVALKPIPFVPKEINTSLSLVDDKVLLSNFKLSTVKVVRMPTWVIPVWTAVLNVPPKVSPSILPLALIIEDVIWVQLIKLGTSLVLRIDDTINEPFDWWTLATLAMFCIKPLPVGLVKVRPPPTFT